MTRKSQAGGAADRRLLDGVRRRLYHLRQRLRLEYLTVTRPIVEISGVKLHVGRHLSRLMRESLYSGLYEEDELNAVKCALTPADVVLELGTGIGLIASYCARLTGSDRVFTYEANRALEPFIRANFRLNGVSPSLNMSILGSENGETEFYVSPDFWASSTKPLHPGMKAVKVRVESLNQAIRRIRPTFFIMDIEGAEYDMIELMEFDGIKKISFEVHEWALGPEKVARMKWRLAREGFILDEGVSTDKEWFLKRML